MNVSCFSSKMYLMHQLCYFWMCHLHRQGHVLDLLKISFQSLEC